MEELLARDNVQLKNLIKGQNDSSSITLGIEGYMTTSRNMSSYNMPEGFYITTITSGSNADKSDLEIGNIITSIDGTKITSADTIKKVLSNKEKGNKISLTIKYSSKNEYKEKTISITLN